jgi:hypothetical protein
LILLCDGTIEDDEYARLIEKERSAAELLGDHTTPTVTHSSMLSELIAARHKMAR